MVSENVPCRVKAAVSNIKLISPAIPPEENSGRPSASSIPSTTLTVNANKPSKLIGSLTSADISCIKVISRRASSRSNPGATTPRFAACREISPRSIVRDRPPLPALPVTSMVRPSREVGSSLLRPAIAPLRVAVPLTATSTPLTTSSTASVRTSWSLVSVISTDSSKPRATPPSSIKVCVKGKVSAAKSKLSIAAPIAAKTFSSTSTVSVVS